MEAVFKRIASFMPDRFVHEAQRLRLRRQVTARRFVPDEPEIGVLTREVKPGSIAIDVGANIGHYTLHLAECVGPTGRVLAMEPIPETFSLLNENVVASGFNNVTLFNAAASSAYSIAMMGVPKLSSGLPNYYQATIGEQGRYRVMCVPIDSLPLPHVDVIKIDAEGHDMEVLKGAEQTILRDHPLLIVETRPDTAIWRWLASLGYSMSHYGRANSVGRWIG